MEEILWCDNSNETSFAALSHGTMFLNKVITLESVDEILLCDHSIETSLQSFYMVLFVSAISIMTFWK